jgi:hypothetical protein
MKGHFFSLLDERETEQVKSCVFKTASLRARTHASAVSFTPLLLCPNDKRCVLCCRVAYRSVQLWKRCFLARKPPLKSILTRKSATVQLSSQTTTVASLLAGVRKVEIAGSTKNRHVGSVVRPAAIVIRMTAHRDTALRRTHLEPPLRASTARCPQLSARRCPTTICTAQKASPLHCRGSLVSGLPRRVHERPSSRGKSGTV